MTRVKRSVHARKKRRATLALAKGYRGDASRHYRTANRAPLHQDGALFCMTITSSHNQRLKQIRKLRMRRRVRERAGRFVAEGEDLLAAADAEGWSAVERYCVAGSGLPGVEVEGKL